MQKLFLISFLALFITTNLAFGQSKKFSSDEAAIKQVIEDESKYFWGRDYKKWKDQWVHEEYIVWTVATADGVRQHKGWKAWSTEVQSLFKADPDPQPYDGVVQKINYNFRIYGDGAWVSFEQINKETRTLETRIMEKEKGKWKIAMVELIFNANQPLGTTTGSSGK